MENSFYSDKERKNIYMVVTVGELYYTGEYQGMMCFSTDVTKAYQYWWRESAEETAKKCSGRVIKYMEVE